MSSSSFQPQSRASHASGASKRSVDVLILGAGLAGTSLALHLGREGFSGTIALVDARRDFSGEARWCCWGEIPAPLDEAVTHRWSSWRVGNGFGDGARQALQHCQSQPYSEIHAPAFFARFHARLASSAGVSLVLGQSAGGWSESGGRVQISTGEGAARTDWDAGRVFDARGLEMARLRRLTDSTARGREIAWTQKFVGQILRFDTPTFDPETVTLMDFDVPQSARGVRFAYVLPFSDRHALVEMTAFSPVAVDESELVGVLNGYAARLGRNAQIEGWERGEIPMNTRALRPLIGERSMAIGAVGGAIRAATGYGFGRTQAQTQSIARALVRGENPSSPLLTPRSRLQSAKFGALDTIFLRALDTGPDFARDCFLRLFEQVSPPALTRFLGETSTMRDEVALIGALPKLAFLGAAARSFSHGALPQRKQGR